MMMTQPVQGWLCGALSACAPLQPPREHIVPSLLCQRLDRLLQGSVEAGPFTEVAAQLTVGRQLRLEPTRCSLSYVVATTAPTAWCQSSCRYMQWSLQTVSYMQVVTTQQT